MPCNTGADNTEPVKFEVMCRIGARGWKYGIVDRKINANQENNNRSGRNEEALTASIASIQYSRNKIDVIIL